MNPTPPILKTLILLLCFTLGLTCAQASQLGLSEVMQPLYLHGSDTDVEITIQKVVVASSGAVPESTYAAIALPFVPPTDGTWNQPHDVNLASLYGIKVSATVDGPEKLTVTIDAKAARVPEGYPFTIGQVVDAVATCVKLMTPTRPKDEQQFTLKMIPRK